MKEKQKYKKKKIIIIIIHFVLIIMGYHTISHMIYIRHSLPSIHYNQTLNITKYNIFMNEMIRIIYKYP